MLFRSYWRRNYFPAYKGQRKHSREASDLDWETIFKAIKEIKNDSDKIMQILFLMSFLMIIFVLASVYFIYSNINRPVQYMRAIVEDISKGELKPVPLFAENTVIGDMSVALNQLSNSFLQTADFANQIENGNLDVQYEKLSERDQLGVALISMQKSLRNYSRNLELQISERTAEVVEKGKKIEVSVPLEFVGTSPAVKDLGGNLVKALHEVKISADQIGRAHV